MKLHGETLKPWGTECCTPKWYSHFGKGETWKILEKVKPLTLPHRRTVDLYKTCHEVLIRSFAFLASFAFSHVLKSKKHSKSACKYVLNEYIMCISLSQVSLSVKSVHKGPLQEQTNQILTLLLVDRKWMHTSIIYIWMSLQNLINCAFCFLPPALKRRRAISFEAAECWAESGRKKLEPNSNSLTVVLVLLRRPPCHWKKIMYPFWILQEIQVAQNQSSIQICWANLQYHIYIRRYTGVSAPRTVWAPT